MSTVCGALRWSSRVFQRRGAAASKALLAIDFSFVLGGAQMVQLTWHLRSECCVFAPWSSRSVLYGHMTLYDQNLRVLTCWEVAMIEVLIFNELRQFQPVKSSNQNHHTRWKMWKLCYGHVDTTQSLADCQYFVSPCDIGDHDLMLAPYWAEPIFTIWLHS